MNGNQDKQRLMAHLCDLKPFFQDARKFLSDLRDGNYLFLGYDCSTQVAIRLIRWSQAIQLTPSQKYVMDQVVSVALQRAAKTIRSRIGKAAWSIPDHQGDHADLALAAAGKALQYLVESHDFCHGKYGEPFPNPSIPAYVEMQTRYLSRAALEYFIYQKRLKSEPVDPESCASSLFRLETLIRQEKSLIRKVDDRKKARKQRELEAMQTALYQAHSVVRLDLRMDDDGDGGRMSSEELLSMSSRDMGPEEELEMAGEVSMPQEQRDFLDLLIRVGNREMAARELIPYLIEKRNFRGIVGLLRVLLKDEDRGGSDTLSSLLGSRGLADIRKQILRINKKDSGELVQIFGVCKSFLRGEASETDVLDTVMRRAACV